MSSTLDRSRRLYRKVGHECHTRDFRAILVKKDFRKSFRLYDMTCMVMELRIHEFRSEFPRATVIGRHVQPKFTFGRLYTRRKKS